MSYDKHYLVNIDGRQTAWLKHQQLLEIRTSSPADQLDKAMLLKRYDSRDFYQDVNMPLYESQLVNGLNADQQMIDLGLDASDLLNDSPANRFSESESQKHRDEPLPQVVPKLYDPSNERSTRRSRPRLRTEPAAGRQRSGHARGDVA